MKHAVKGLQGLLERHTAARFVLAGGANTVFGFVVYTCAVFAHAPVWAALLAGVLAGVVFNFMTIGRYAFRQLAWKNFPRFVLSYAAVYLTNLGAVEVLTRQGLGPVVAQAVVTLPLAALSYLLMRFAVFNRRPDGGNASGDRLSTQRSR